MTTYKKLNYEMAKLLKKKGFITSISKDDIGNTFVNTQKGKFNIFDPDTILDLIYAYGISIHRYEKEIKWTAYKGDIELTDTTLTLAVCYLAKKLDYIEQQEKKDNKNWYEERFIYKNPVKELLDDFDRFHNPIRSTAIGTIREGILKDTYYPLLNIKCENGDAFIKVNDDWVEFTMENNEVLDLCMEKYKPNIEYCKDMQQWIISKGTKFMYGNNLGLLLERFIIELTLDINFKD